MYKDKWAHTEPMGPKYTLRLMRILGPSPASLAQSSWSLLSNALRGRIASENMHLFFNKYAIQRRLPPSVPKHDFEVINLTIAL